jgi:hypothetical protein
VQLRLLTSSFEVERASNFNKKALIIYQPCSSASTGPRFLLVYIALTGYSGYVIPQGSTEKTASFSALP